MKLFWIQWEDAFHPETCGWMSEKDVDEFCKDAEYICEYVGWIIKEDKRTITIASMISGKNGAFSHIQKIPKGCILKKKVIKL
jgi:hypothetical protein